MMNVLHECFLFKLLPFELMHNGLHDFHKLGLINHKQKDSPKLIKQSGVKCREQTIAVLGLNILSFLLAKWISLARHSSCSLLTSAAGNWTHGS